MSKSLMKNGRVALSEQEKKFADSYLVCSNASRAAREAGYAERSAGVAGNRLLKRPRVQEYLRVTAERRLAREAEKPTPEIDLQTRVLRELELMAFANIQDFITVDADGKPQVDFSTATREQLAAITSIVSKTKTTRDRSGSVTTEAESRFVMADKYRGLEGLGKHLGMFKEAEQRVVIDVADRLLAARQRLRQIEDGGAL